MCCIYGRRSQRTTCWRTLSSTTRTRKWYGRPPRLREGRPEDADFAKVAFGFVRDNISHSWDAKDPRVTLSASDVLRQGVGLCCAKAHLLAGLLRAQGVPTGLCYQRLTDDGEQFDVHGLTAVYLDGAVASP